MTDYAAFISYSSRYREWVKVLQTNLEACLAHLVAPRQSIFLDQVDLAPGQSSISQLENGLIQADKLILIVTPEAVASPQVESEWQTVVDRHPDWQRQGRILPVQLIWTPLSPFLNKVQPLDFTDAENYNYDMRRLVGALIDLPPRQPPELPELDVPDHPESVPLKNFRKELIEWMAPFLESRIIRKGFVGAFNLKPPSLIDDFSSPELAASALYLHATKVLGKQDSSVTKRIIAKLIEELSEEYPDEIRRLRKLEMRLDKKPIKAKQIVPVLDPVNGCFENTSAHSNAYDYDTLRDFRLRMRPDQRQIYPLELTDHEFLVRRGVLRDGHLTIAGILLFSSLPSQLLVSAKVQCVRYAGTSRSAAREKRVFQASLIYQIQKSRDFVEAYTETFEIPSEHGAEPKKIYRYPLKTLREVIVNAICHRRYDLNDDVVHIRMYSDRIEISSPGEWVTKKIAIEGIEIPLDQLEGQSKKRNPIIHDAVTSIDLAEAEGLGIKVAIDECRQARIPIPKVRLEDGNIIIKIFPRGRWPPEEVLARSGSKTNDLLSHYLAQVERDHRSLVPFFQQQTEFNLLDRVYVRLELQTQYLSRGLGKDEGKERFRLQIGIRQLIALDPSKHSWVTRRWIIRGDPGGGKTTLLRHLAATLARDPDSRWVPVFESLPRLLREREFLFNRVTRNLQRTMKEAADGLVRVFEYEAGQGRLLILLDGLDEVSDRDEAQTLLRNFSERWPEATIIVTSRLIGYQRPDKTFVEVDILPLDEERQRTFLACWFGRHTNQNNEATATFALEALRSNRNLLDLACNPLYLTLMALLIERNEKIARLRTSLYDQIFELLLEGGHRPDGEPMDLRDATRSALRYLAHRMTEDNLDALPVQTLEELLYHPDADQIRKRLERFPRWKRSVRLFLDDLANRTSILGPHDGSGTDWRYWHRTFREALASEQLAEMFREPNGKVAILKHARSIAGSESQWAEPYALLTGRLDKPDDLVLTLVEENLALGLRALATAQTLKDETLTEILNLSDDWKERIKVYEQLPDLIDDPERLLPLLNRLRTRTRNGNDLFYLDLMFSEVGKRWPTTATKAEELRALLYAHIPSPSEELFQRIETPKDGWVDLWRMVPDGSFLLGSPEDEIDREEDEGPQVKVNILRPFKIACVPVTQEQFAAFDPGHRNHRKGAHYPAERVTWFQAVSFCRWLSQSFSWARGARLPSEEEWEYVCRAGTTTRFWSGDEKKDLDIAGWYGEGVSTSCRTHRVGEKDANPWGLFDVHGNVWEWTCSEDKVYTELGAEISIDPRAKPSVVANTSSLLGIRGGSYMDDFRTLRSAFRDWSQPGDEDLIGALGFRILLPFLKGPD